MTQREWMAEFKERGVRPLNKKQIARLLAEEKMWNKPYLDFDKCVYLRGGMRPVLCLMVLLKSDRMAENFDRLKACVNKQKLERYKKAWVKGGQNLLDSALLTCLKTLTLEQLEAQRDHWPDTKNKLCNENAWKEEMGVWKKRLG